MPFRTNKKTVVEERTMGEFKNVSADILDGSTAGEFTYIENGNVAEEESE